MSSAPKTYASLSRLTDEASALLDASGSVVTANEKMFALFGQQIEGYPIDRFIRAPGFSEALRQVTQDATFSQLDYKRVDQTQRAYEIRLAPLDDNHVMMVVADKTDILAVNRVRSDFVANVSHELRSPLTALTGFIETLQDSAADDAAARSKFLDIMQSEAARMQRLIDDLLSLSRVEAEEHHAPQGQVDLQQLLATIMSLLQPRADDREIKLQLSIDPDMTQDGLSVVGNGDELEQVFINLIENAIRYGDAGEPVQLVVSEGRMTPGDTLNAALLRVQVINKGPVINEEHLARLTERFYRIDRGRSRQIGGTGLGLAIVKHIINKHRGRLRITSDPQATVFSVTLQRGS